MSASTRLQLPVVYDDVVDAARRLEPVVHHTPVLTARSLDECSGAHVWLKCENFQRAGAFKFRGAYNALARLAVETPERGALAYSSGNHAQAMALAGRLLGVSTTIIMPQDASSVKLEATRAYGAEIVTYDRFSTAREELGQAIAAERGLALIPPFDHPDVVAGQGTAARELLQAVGGLDLLLTPCGGGGLLSGSALVARALQPGCQVVGVEPEAGDDATRSFHSGRLQSVDNPETIADGARTTSLGEITFPMVLELVDGMVTVSDDALVRAMRFLMERLKIVVEPTGALGVAALLEGKVECEGKRVGVLISGGNVDLRQLAAWLGSP